LSSFQDYITTLNSGTYKQKIKLELLRSDETVQKEITSSLANTTGNLSIQRANGLRRNCNFNIINLDGTYIPNIDNYFWVRQKFQLYLGLELSDGTDYWISQGIFILNDPLVSSNRSESYISINATDKFGILTETGGELSEIYQIPVGTNVIDAINSILVLINDPKEPIIDVSLVGETVPYTMIYQASDKIGQILIDLAQLYSCSIYYNNFGQLVVEKDIDDEIKPSIWDFTTEQFLYRGATNKYKFSEVFNSVLVVGANINGSIYSYKAQDLNLLSNTSIPNLGFERIYRYESDTLDSLQKVTDLANYILKRKIAIQNEVQINSIPMYHLDVDQIITLTDTNLDLSRERFLVNSLDIPLKTGSEISINCVKSKEIPFI
jgi:hypothetical protein